jgi:hypothetical protein
MQQFFRLTHNREYAFKIFSDDKINKIALETDVYLKLNQSDYYPVYYGKGSNYLVISYEEGITLYDCLTYFHALFLTVLFSYSI